MSTQSITNPDTYKIVFDRIRSDSLRHESCRPFFVIFILLSQFALSSNMTIDMKVRAIEQDNDRLLLDCQKINPKYQNSIIEIPPCIHNDLLEFIENKQPDDYVFTSSRGGRYYQQKFSSYISQLATILDIRDLNSIRLRSLATNKQFWNALNESTGQQQIEQSVTNPLTPLSEITKSYQKIVESQNISCRIAENLLCNYQFDPLLLFELQNSYSDIIEKQNRLLKYLELLNKKTDS